MDQHQKTLRVGAAAVVCAVVLRLLGSGSLAPVGQWLQQPEIQSFLIYLETGRILRFSPSSPGNAHSTESPGPALPLSGVQGELPVFTASDAAGVEMYYACSLRPDLESLITQPLEWDLTGDEPTVLIIHTHATESYTPSPGETYQESALYRTLDEDYNMISMGDRLTELLSAQGITVIHDRSLHDYPSYNGSYAASRTTVSDYLSRYPSIRLVLDLHRDASGNGRNQLRTCATVSGQTSAQLMLVVGTDAAGLNHPDWEENLSLGLKLHTLLERIAPGITRPVCLRAQRFNQDLLPGALLIEVGAAGNTHAEALLAVEVLAQAIIALAYGSG